MVLNPQEEGLRETVVTREGEERHFEAGAALRQSSLWRDALRRFTHNRAALIAMIEAADFFAGAWPSEPSVWDAIALKCSDKVRARVLAGKIKGGPPPRFAIITCESVEDAEALQEKYKRSNVPIPKRVVSRHFYARPRPRTK